MIDDVSKLGGEIVLIEDNREYPSEEEYLVLLYEFKYGLESYLAQSSEPKKTLQKIIDYNNDYSEQIMPFWSRDILCFFRCC